MVVYIRKYDSIERMAIIDKRIEPRSLLERIDPLRAF
jgi:hypothetical protein